MKNEHTIFLCRRAKQRGIKCQTLESDDSFCVLSKGKQIHLVYGGIVSDNSSASGYELARSKVVAREFLKINKFPVLPQIKTKEFGEAKKFLEKHKKVVVKPMKLKQGKGISVGIETVRQLKQAWRYANQFTKHSKVIEKYYPGVDHRVLVINYKNVFAVQRFPAYVIGNGRDSIKKLISIKNLQETPEQRKKPIIIDQPMKAFLSGQKLSLYYVPKENQKIILRGTANIRTGGESRDCTDELSSEVKKQAITIAKLLKTDVIGIDYLAEDINKKRYIIELNSDPGVQLHHFPTHGKKREPIEKFLDMLF